MTTTPAHPGIPEPPKGEMYFPIPAIPNRVIKMEDDIMERICRLIFAGQLVEKIDDLPKELVPEEDAAERGKVRSRIIAALGLKCEEDDGQPLAELAKKAMERKSSDLALPVLTFMDNVCHRCAKEQYIVTDMCQNCTARPCAETCAKKAIDHTTGKAHIDPAKCVRCGNCAKACPFGAIIHKVTPCVAHCPVGAIETLPDDRKVFHFDKCISCGQCVRNCPFGAVEPRTEVTDVVRGIMYPKRKMVAMLAPAVAGHFPHPISIASLKEACVKAGFDVCIEVAVGADVTTLTEAAEFDERMENFEQKKEGALPFMATSCCPAWVNMVHQHIPEIESAISHTGSPMHYIGNICKERYPGCETVFVGPCIAKLTEGLRKEQIDYVLTFQDLNAILRSRDVTFKPNLPDDPADPDVGCSESRMYPIIAGVASAVASVRIKAPEKYPHAVTPVVCDGLSPESFKKIKTFGKTAPPGNLLEVMSCRGGCCHGPGSLLNATMSSSRCKMTATKSKHHPDSATPVVLKPTYIIDGKFVDADHL